MPTVVLSPIGNDAPFVDSNGNPLSGGLLYFYDAGTTTPQATYTTIAGSVQNANPVVLNANGYPASGGNVVSIWMIDGADYKVELQTSAGVPIWTRDNITGVNDSNVALTPATQAQQETGTSTTVYVSPARQQFHKSAAKAWAYVDASGATFTIASSFNISSIADGGVGIYTLTPTTAFTAANTYPAVATAYFASGISFCTAQVNGTSSIAVGIFNGTPSPPVLVDNIPSSVVAFGDQ